MNINENSGELLNRIYIADLEEQKKFDIFISHSAKDKNEIVSFYKKLNTLGMVVYVDWVNDKHDLKKEWVNKSTSQVLKKD